MSRNTQPGACRPPGGGLCLAWSRWTGRAGASGRAAPCQLACCPLSPSLSCSLGWQAAAPVLPELTGLGLCSGPSLSCLVAAHQVAGPLLSSASSAGTRQQRAPGQGGPRAASYSPFQRVCGFRWSWCRSGSVLAWKNLLQGLPVCLLVLTAALQVLPEALLVLPAALLVLPAASLVLLITLLVLPAALLVLPAALLVQQGPLSKQAACSSLPQPCGQGVMSPKPPGDIPPAPSTLPASPLLFPPVPCSETRPSHAATSHGDVTQLL